MKTKKVASAKDRTFLIITIPIVALFFLFNVHCLCNSWNDIGENKAEDITNDQSAEDVRYKVHSTEQALAANLTVQAHRQQ